MRAYHRDRRRVPLKPAPPRSNLKVETGTCVCRLSSNIDAIYYHHVGSSTFKKAGGVVPPCARRYGRLPCEGARRGTGAGLREAARGARSPARRGRAGRRCRYECAACCCSAPAPARRAASCSTNAPACRITAAHGPYARPIRHESRARAPNAERRAAARRWPQGAPDWCTAADAVAAGAGRGGESRPCARPRPHAASRHISPSAPSASW